MFHGITYVLQGTQICYYKKQNQKQRQATYISSFSRAREECIAGFIFPR